LLEQLAGVVPASISVLEVCNAERLCENASVIARPRTNSYSGVSRRKNGWGTELRLKINKLRYVAVIMNLKSVLSRTVWLPLPPTRNAVLGSDEENYSTRFRSGDLFTQPPEQADMTERTCKCSTMSGSPSSGHALCSAKARWRPLPDIGNVGYRASVSIGHGTCEHMDAAMRTT
jgi:hypothetical protein